MVGDEADWDIENLGQITGTQIPGAEDKEALKDDAEDDHAVLFVPEGTDPADTLNIRVVRVKGASFDTLVQRRC